MKTHYVYIDELQDPNDRPAEESGKKEVVLLADAEHIIDHHMERAKSARAELEAVRILLDAHPNESAIAAALRARREREARRIDELAEPVVVD